MVRILVVEDDEAIANLIAMSLRKINFSCETVYDGATAADLMQEKHFDLGIFDIMLPGFDGYELLQFAKTLELPVIFLTAKGETVDKVKGLRAGADDYISKPFEITELLARVESILRRTHGMQKKYRIGDLSIDTVSRTVYKNQQKIDLTYKEFELLLLFVQNANIALRRETIYEQVWDNPYMGESRTVDLHIQRLRKKTGLLSEIQSVYKVGYRFTWKEG